jgi:hypothetical protein
MRSWRRPYKAAYVAAKHGIAGLTQNGRVRNSDDGYNHELQFAQVAVWTPTGSKANP